MSQKPNFENVNMARPEFRTKQLTLDERKRILGPDGQPFNIGAVTLVMNKVYVATESNLARVVSNAELVANNNGLDYFLLIKDEARWNIVEYGYPGNWRPEQVTGIEKANLYTANFYAIPKVGLNS